MPGVIQVIREEGPPIPPGERLTVPTGAPRDLVQESKLPNWGAVVEVRYVQQPDEVTWLTQVGKTGKALFDVFKGKPQQVGLRVFEDAFREVEVTNSPYMTEQEKNAALEIIRTSTIFDEVEDIVIPRGSVPVRKPQAASTSNPSIVPIIYYIDP